jgi:hypothetical protein
VSTPPPPPGDRSNDPYGPPPPESENGGSSGAQQYGEQPPPPPGGGYPQYGGQQYGGQQQGYPQYGGQGGYAGYGEPPSQARNGMGWAALILGILGIVSFWLLIGGLFGLLAIIFGVIGVRRASRREATNKGVAIVGIVLGTLALIGAVVIGALLGAVWNSEEFGNLRECLAEAGSDQSAVDDCQRQFEDEVQNGGTNQSLRLVIR